MRLAIEQLLLLGGEHGADRRPQRVRSRAQLGEHALEDRLVARPLEFEQRIDGGALGSGEIHAPERTGVGALTGTRVRGGRCRALSAVALLRGAEEHADDENHREQEKRQHPRATGVWSAFAHRSLSLRTLVTIRAATPDPRAGPNPPSVRAPPARPLPRSASPRARSARVGARETTRRSRVAPRRLPPRAAAAPMPRAHPTPSRACACGRRAFPARAPGPRGRRGRRDPDPARAARDRGARHPCRGPSVWSLIAPGPSAWRRTPRATNRCWRDITSEIPSATEIMRWSPPSRSLSTQAARW